MLRRPAKSVSSANRNVKCTFWYFDHSRSERDRELLILLDISGHWLNREQDRDIAQPSTLHPAVVLKYAESNIIIVKQQECINYPSKT